MEAAATTTTTITTEISWGNLVTPVHYDRPMHYIINNGKKYNVCGNNKLKVIKQSIIGDSV